MVCRCGTWAFIYITLVRSIWLANSVPLTKKAIVLFAHGSPDPAWHTHIHAIATKVKETNQDINVCCAYLGHTQPSLLDAVTQLANEGIAEISITPVFLGVGRHLREDLPKLLEEVQKAHPSLTILTQPPLGENEQLINLMAQIASSRLV